MRKREKQTDREGGREEVEGNSARGLLPDLYNSFITEAVQRENRANACVQKYTHTHTDATTNIHKQDRAGA